MEERKKVTKEHIKRVCELLDNAPQEPFENPWAEGSRTTVEAVLKQEGVRLVFTPDGSPFKYSIGWFDFRINPNLPDGYLRDAFGELYKCEGLFE